MKKFVFLLFLMAPCAVSASDYGLTIADDINAPCTKRVKKIHEDCKSQKAKGIKCDSDAAWPLKTSKEVIESINIYFSGGKPPIKILSAAFSHDYLDFCSPKETRKIYDALKIIKKRATYKHKRMIDDFINVVEKHMRSDPHS